MNVSQNKIKITICDAQVQSQCLFKKKWIQHAQSEPDKCASLRTEKEELKKCTE